MMENKSYIYAISEDGDVFANLDIKKGLFLEENKNMIKNPFEVFSIIPNFLRDFPDILMNDGTLITKGVVKYPPPLFLFTHITDYYIIPTTDTSVMLNLRNAKKETIGINMVNMFSHGGGVFMVDEMMNIYTFSFDKGLTKISFMDEHIFNNILCIGGRVGRFFILDGNIWYRATDRYNGYILEAISDKYGNIISKQIPVNRDSMGDIVQDRYLFKKIYSTHGRYL